LLPSNIKQLSNQFSYPLEKENVVDRNKKASDYEQEDGHLSEQRKRLKAAQVGY